MSKLIQKAGFVVVVRYYPLLKSFFRKLRLKTLGMHIGKGTIIPKIYTTWPHQISLGNNCKLEHNIYFKFDGIWRQGRSINIGDNVFIGNNCEFNIRADITIGSNSLIASGCRFIDHDHGIELHVLMNKQEGIEKAIHIGEDVWIGCNVVILKGVTIGHGAVVAAGAVVTKSIPPLEIWGGVPAKKISQRG
ncbi:acyltransferase [Mucilaginibacter paludis]|uniref:Galactoside acetyltransferase (LacA) n=1 Tax=Mucilaginibacter paludis DSM 18603 TaxID=714943 RepID=H1Y0I7_9SPHI|nr:acyltransferase [Mucilaginibacter paludis]EHQ28454.1 galactoside acetyltransferase (LacA) [Mucilaginibacter paludis DSM 18603]